MIRKGFVAAMMAVAFTLTAQAQVTGDVAIESGPFEANWESLKAWECPEWFRDVKFGIWALAHKYLEQWFIWIAVDVVACWLYFTKDIPFKASLYGLYVIIAIAGYRSWRRKMSLQPPSTTSQRRN